MKARLIKKADVVQTETNGHKKAFKPKKGLSEEDNLRRILASWMEVVDSPQHYSTKDYLNACNEALECVKAIKRLLRKQNKADIHESHVRFGILFAEEVESVRPKKDCKLPKSQGHGLRVPPKPSDPIRQGRGPTPGAAATIKTAWPDHSNGPATETPHKGDGRYNGAIGSNFRSWRGKKPSRNGNGNGRK